jgi:prolipoprotein diacylglyceryltransferase
MKKLVILSLLLFLALPTLVSAECTLNGEVVPCSEMPTWFWIFIAIFAIVGILAFIFWIWMFVDCIRFEENKLLWILIIIFAQIIGAILYYFLAKRKRNQQTSMQPKV